MKKIGIILLTAMLCAGCQSGGLEAETTTFTEPTSVTGESLSEGSTVPASAPPTETKTVSACVDHETEIFLRGNRDIDNYDLELLDQVSVLKITVEGECDLSFLSRAKRVNSLTIVNGESYADREPMESYVESFAFLSELNGLKELNIYGVKDFPLSYFNELPDLNAVTLSACGMNGSLSANSPVKKLALYCCDFEADLLRCFPDLTELWIDGKVDDFSFPEEMENLRFLSLTMTGFSDMEKLSACTNLTDLTVMSRNGSKATPLENIEFCKGLPDLKKLTVYRGSLSAEQKETAALLLPNCEIVEYEAP